MDEKNEGQSCLKHFLSSDGIQIDAVGAGAGFTAGLSPCHPCMMTSKYVRYIIWHQIRDVLIPMSWSSLCPCPTLPAVNRVQEKWIHVLQSNAVILLSERPVLQSTYWWKKCWWQGTSNQMYTAERTQRNLKSGTEFQAKYIKDLCSALLVLYRCIFSRILTSESRFSLISISVIIQWDRVARKCTLR